ncbi:MAG: hypothetical protein ACJ739_01935 [Acidimicrobiales bacterium]
MLSEDWPTAWAPFAVEVRPDGDCLELIATGHLDRWTAGALLRNLIAVCEPCYREVHLDLRQVDAAEEAGEVLARCRTFAEGRGLRLRVSPPAAPPDRIHPMVLPAAGH